MSSWWLMLLLFFVTADATKMAPDDLDLLDQFKAAVANVKALNGWTSHNGSCSFPGVRCKNGRVTSVSLTGINLNTSFGAVSSTLLQLTSVEAITVRDAGITGMLSAARVIACGEKLSLLDLSGNSGLNGSVTDIAAMVSVCHGLRVLNFSGDGVGAVKPAGEGSIAFAGLEVLDLSNNRIDGDDDLRWMISAGAGGMRWLDLSSNMISGEVPVFINCSGLQYLDLSSNRLYSSVAAGVLSGCGGLSVLNLSSNSFASMFPPDIARLVSLTVLNLSCNNFSGVIPGKAFVNLPTLRTLALSFNYFNGSIPDAVTMLPELEILDLSSNALSGTIPASLCFLKTITKLQLLYLQNNYLIVGIPETISNCTGLITLDLSLNHLNGQIPSSLGMLSILRDLVLWQNELSGDIPASLSTMHKLETLILDYNNLVGSIPSGLGNCTELKWMSLASNRLSGLLPTWFGQLVNLQILRLGNNSFSGSIPPELGDCKNLLWLDLSANQLNGGIPSELAKQSGKITIDFSSTQLVYLRNDEATIGQFHGKGSLLDIIGIRHADLSRMPSKKTCNFTSMYIGTFISYTNSSIIFLDLSFNQLDGEIPKQLGSMFYLMILNLGHNRLSGMIPPELDGAKKLAVLDLSHNSLEGPIPNSFSWLSLSEIDLSNNRMSGMIPELGSLGTFPKSQYENNSGLCGFPLLRCEHKLISAVNTQKPKSRKRQAFLAGSVATVVLLLLFALSICLFQKKKSKAHNGNEYVQVQGNLFSIWNFNRGDAYKQIVEVTENFSERHCIGRGGNGSVYRAELPTGNIFAVKKVWKIEDDNSVIKDPFHREIVALLLQL